jgi:hypothetical protein
MQPEEPVSGQVKGICEYSKRLLFEIDPDQVFENDSSGMLRRVNWSFAWLTGEWQSGDSILPEQDNVV